jgi:hypothetical protein
MPNPYSLPILGLLVLFRVSCIHPPFANREMKFITTALAARGSLKRPLDIIRVFKSGVVL